MNQSSARGTTVIAILTVLATVISPFVTAVPTAFADQESYGVAKLTVRMVGNAESGAPFWYDISDTTFRAYGRFVEDGVTTFHSMAVGQYSVVFRPMSGYVYTYSGDCSESGQFKVIAGDAITCDVAVAEVPSSSREATLIVEKRLWNYGIGTSLFSDFSYTLNGERHQLEVDGANTVAVDHGIEYTVAEIPAEGYAVSYGGACDASGKVTLGRGETGICIVTNWLAVGGYNPEDGIPLAYAKAQEKAAQAVLPLRGPDADTIPVSSASASPSEDVNLQTADAGGILGLDVCADAGKALWWITLVVLAAVLLWFGRRRGTYLWLIVIYGVVWFLWAWKFCAFGFWWLPLLMAVIIWLLSVPKPKDASEDK